MIHATTTRPVDLSQLAAELGTTLLSTATEGETTTVICHDDTVALEALDAAVAAHVPTPPAPPMSAEEVQATVDWLVVEQLEQTSALQAQIAAQQELLDWLLLSSLSEEPTL